MESLKWNNPHRRRKTTISFSDDEYVVGYDLDLADFANLVQKHKAETLSYTEDVRYGNHILTLIEIVLEGPKFKNKTSSEKSALREQMYYELLPGIRSFDPTRGSSIYSYAYRIAYVAGCHYYTNLAKTNARQNAINQHCQEEYEDYLEEYSSHKKGIPHGRE